ncbi:hypothetical protein chiPu_0031500, partial [Chiloscyllium punctatum]|nr:hypothetical protein [Chiloscyllium punctatum]
RPAFRPCHQRLRAARPALEVGLSARHRRTAAGGVRQAAVEAAGSGIAGIEAVGRGLPLAGRHGRAAVPDAASRIGACDRCGHDRRRHRIDEPAPAQPDAWSLCCRCVVVPRRGATARLPARPEGSGGLDRQPRRPGHSLTAQQSRRTRPHPGNCGARAAAAPATRRRQGIPRSHRVPGRSRSERRARSLQR